MTPTAVVLGATGRLGRRLLPAFAAAGFTTIAVARTGQPELGRWITADLTMPEERARVAATLATWASRRGPVCIVDAVLDRRGVDAMRRSVRGVTDTVLLLGERLGASAGRTSLVAASTTAVLAPGVYQTPYGLAKRRQIVTYARSGMAGVGLVLPVLSDQGGADPTDLSLGQAWSFDHAAGQVVATAAAQHCRFVIRVPDLNPVQAAELVEAAPAVRAVLLAHLRGLLMDRNSMEAHRIAARGRLGLSPGQIRRRVDHHRAPAELVRRFADRYRVSIVRDRPFGSQSAGDGDGGDHAR